MKCKRTKKKENVKDLEITEHLTYHRVFLSALLVLLIFSFSPFHIDLHVNLRAGSLNI